MKTFSTYLVLATLGLTAVGCSDDSDDAAPSKTTLLTAKSWRPTAITVAGTNYIDFLLAEPCDKDDFITFKADKTAVYDEGADKCDTASPQTSTGSWEFTNSEAKLKLTDPSGEVIEGDILTLNSTTLSVRSSQDLLGTGTLVPVDFTFTAK
ncbi:lipocalin family protein [Hymenobacter sp. ASUV-10]|uniref:Lipocalin family protein n=1 Tax=Hymenobacter aranciens TaxID=3063996 RepID=A0ABT9B8C3_9BACT|nr:lipocalin family protein [Hymenobacter sp. ASUV-10]MDO7873252.1 lipocalin family protein [Hymenobacter sp. ASUV-10]